MKRLISVTTSVLILFLQLLFFGGMVEGQDLSQNPSLSSGRVISKIDVEGNQRIEGETILLQVGSRVGSQLDPAQVERDIKEIYRAGFFDRVLARVDNSSGAPRLVFVVQEKPAIRSVLLQGNEELSNDTLKEKLSIGERRFLDRRKIRAGIADAIKHYESKGYYGTKINLVEKNVENNQVDLTFVVAEGKKKVIRKLTFEGIQQVDGSDLEDVIKTGTYSRWSSWITGTGYLNQEQLDNDVRELQNYYMSHGFVEAKIGEPVVKENEENLEVVFQVQEGDVFSYGDISVSGDLVEGGEEATLVGIESKKGDTFDITKLRKDTFTISEKFTDIGYAFANVEPATDVNRSAKTVQIRFVVNKGSLITVNRITFTGNSKTADNVIRRSLKVAEQELFSSSKVKRSQELLRRLGYFDEVTLTPEPSELPDTVDLNIGVKEASTGSFSFGAGVSSGDGFIATARISENNFFGTGRIVSFDINSGSKRENFVVSFDDPRVNDTKWSFGLDGIKTKRDFDEFDRNQKGGAASVGHPIWFLGEELADDIRFSLRYEFLDIDIDDVEADAPQLVKESEGSSTSSSITPRIVRNTVDNPIDPENGSRQSIGFEYAGLGGSEEFWVAEASNSWYYPLIETSFGNLVFAQRTRLNYGDTFDDDRFPLFKRYFPGGINSVRGYDSRELGPKDENDKEFGGSKELIANFEMIFPIFKTIGIKGLLFYDAGQAFDDDQEIEIAKLRQAVGFGIRWRSPLAPIRVEFGWPIDTEEGEDGGIVTNFTFGAPQ